MPKKWFGKIIRHNNHYFLTNTNAFFKAQSTWPYCIIMYIGLSKTNFSLPATAILYNDWQIIIGRNRRNSNSVTVENGRLTMTHQ